MKIEFTEEDTFIIVAKEEYPNIPIPQRFSEINVTDRAGNDVWGTVTRIVYRLSENRGISVYFAPNNDDVLES